MRFRLIGLGVACALAGAAVTIPFALAGQSTSSKVLFSVLTGKKEVDQQGHKGAGDPDGRGTFSALIDGGQLCFGITVRNIGDPLAAHIHRGGPKVAGDIVVPLEPIPDSGDPGASAGCVPVTSGQAAAILKNPHRFYANVHTEAFPGGAVRGQLFGRRR